MEIIIKVFTALPVNSEDLNVTVPVRQNINFIHLHANIIS